MFKNDHDPAMRYEGLARAAFDNCDKYDDPWKYAAQEKYNQFVKEVSIGGKRMLSTILLKIIFDYLNHSEVDKLIALEKSIWDATEQDQIIEIIDSASEILEMFKE
ncbi:MAG: hypothetical protein K9J24_00325 [Bacteroidales bacterium]|nr:hypothetical protein [Bacteroidales bacterium]